ncbi:MAG: helix-turn-helix transcriptional regulator [Deltaproteobacteria bacterium]|nr:helix-turn-helix transcriptional regulator [Deltaproteobacteria bacterium]
MVRTNIFTGTLRPKVLLNSRQIDIIKNIRQKRKELGITQKSLAEKTKLSQSYIATIENFEQFPSDESLKKILETLNISYFELPQRVSRNIDRIPLSDKLILDNNEVIVLNNNMKKTVPISDNIKDFINNIGAYNALYYAYYVQDDSLDPIIKKGNLVIIEYREIEISKEYNEFKCANKFVVATNDSRTEVIIRKLSDTNPFVLYSINPDYYSYDLKIPDGYWKFKINPENKRLYDISKYDNEKWYIKGILLFAIEEKSLLKD